MPTNHTQAYIDEVDAIKAAACYPYRSDLNPSYGYNPSFAAGILFSILFVIPLFYHTFQSARLRATTSILLALGALTELIGWVGRAYNGKCPYNSTAFMSQEVTLIIAPVFFSAALYVLLGKLIIDLGPRASMISAKWYAIVFCSCDIGSLIVQAIGGAKASMADTDADMELGTHIMVAGIAFQLLTMTLFAGLLADFLLRVLRRGSEFQGTVTKGMKLVFVALIISTLMIYIRGVYRTIELAQGWHGYLITHEGYFIGLDAAIMVVAVSVFVPVDPAVVFRGEGRPGFARKMRGAKGSSSSVEASDTPLELAMEPIPGRY